MDQVFSFNRALAIAHKEVRHILRDPFTLATAIGVPLMMLIFFGYVIDLNVRDVHFRVADQDHSRTSRELLAVFASSGFFKLDRAPQDGNPMRTLDAEQARGLLLIHPGFGDALGAGRPVEAQILLDGTDNSAALTVLGYLAGIQQAAWSRWAARPSELPIRLQSRFAFHPELNSRWFIVPGLVVVIIASLSISLTALTVAREWETGSMELLLSTPVRPLEIVLGKLAPYLVLVLFGILLVYLAARLGFGIPFRGNHLLLFLGCLLFVTPSLAQGLVISVATRQQQLAMQIGFISGLLPSLLLSGFIFPVESMPALFRGFTVILASRWFMDICRGLFLKNAGIAELILPLGMLLLLNAVFVTAALRLFKRDVEP